MSDDEIEKMRKRNQQNINKIRRIHVEKKQAIEKFYSDFLETILVEMIDSEGVVAVDYDIPEHDFSY